MARPKQWCVPGVNLGTTGDSGVQEESDGRRGHFSGAADNQGKLCGVQGMMVESYPHHHMERSLRIVLPQNIGVYVGRGEP